MVLKFKDGPTKLDMAYEDFLILINGMPSSGKTQLTESIILSFLGVETDYFQFEDLPENAKILRVDTEMPMKLLKKSEERLIKLCGRDINNEYILMQTSHIMPNISRIDHIKKLVDSDDMIKVLIIDNLTGTVSSIMRDDEAALVTAFLDRLAKEKKIMVICLCHSAGDGTPIGHIGKTMNRQASFTVSLTLDKTDSTTYATINKPRADKIPDFSFTLDNNKQVSRGVYMPFP